MPLICVFSPLFSSDACGTTIGCFEFPPGCAGPDTCDFYLTWTLDSNGDNIFDMSGAATSYVAVGFSKSGKMVRVLFQFVPTLSVLCITVEVILLNLILWINVNVISKKQIERTAGMLFTAII